MALQDQNTPKTPEDQQEEYKKNPFSAHPKGKSKESQRKV